MPEFPPDTRVLSRTPDGDRECYQFEFNADGLERLRAERRPVADRAPRAPRSGISSVPLFVADIDSETW